ncbi:MAG: ATP-binding protein [Micromonosporaceae bacterium]
MTVLVAATACLVLVAFVVPLALLVRTVAQSRAITAASADMQAVAVLLASGDLDDVEVGLESTRRPISVFLPDGTVLGPPAPRTPAVRLATTGRSLSTDTAGGREMVLAVGRTDGTYVVRTVVTEDEQTRGVGSAWGVLAALGLLLVLYGLFLADRFARTLTVPMRDLSAVSGRLARGDLSARAVPAGAPEVRDVAGALNHLAGRITDLLHAERESVADLSHRLRTPLTALRLEAESLADPTESARVTERVDEFQRAVTELIRTARHRAGGPGRCDATEVVRERVEFWSALADDTDRAVEVSLPDRPVPVGLPPDELTAAVDALLGNVFAHTPDGTRFEVRLTPADPGGALLVVRDHGPGLPAQMLVERGASGGDSTGLGLDFVRRAAALSGGRLHLATGAAGGTTVTVELGAPAADPPASGQWSDRRPTP